MSLNILVANIDWRVKRDMYRYYYEFSGCVNGYNVLIRADAYYVEAYIAFGKNGDSYAGKRIDGTRGIASNHSGELTKSQIKDYERVLVVMDVFIWQIRSSYLKLELDYDL